MKSQSLYLRGAVDTEFTALLMRWFKDEGAAAKPRPDWAGKLLMGFPLYGEDFINGFKDFCLPSILAPRNAAALRGRGVITIYTEAKDAAKLKKALRPAERAGIDVDVRIIPKVIFDRLRASTPISRYWLLGTINNMNLQEARQSGMGYHMMMPDHVYCEGFFENLFRLSIEHDAIAQTSLSVDKAGCQPDLDEYRHGDALVISPSELGDLALDNIHPLTASTCMNGRDLWTGMPDSHFIWWRGKHSVSLFCCHLNVTYIAPSLTAKAPTRLFNALDVELPAFVPGDIYVPVPEDDMAYVEISGPRNASLDKDVSLNMWVLRCGVTTHFQPIYDRFFMLRSFLPTSEQDDFVEDDEIVRTHTALHNAMISGRPLVEAIHDEEADKLSFDPMKEVA